MLGVLAISIVNQSHAMMKQATSQSILDKVLTQARKHRGAIGFVAGCAVSLYLYKHSDAIMQLLNREHTAAPIPMPVIASAPAAAVPVAVPAPAIRQYLVHTNNAAVLHVPNMPTVFAAEQSQSFPHIQNFSFSHRNQSTHPGLILLQTTDRNNILITIRRRANTRADFNNIVGTVSLDPVSNRPVVTIYHNDKNNNLEGHADCIVEFPKGTTFYLES